MNSYSDRTRLGVAAHQAYTHADRIPLHHTTQSIVCTSIGSRELRKGVVEVNAIRFRRPTSLRDGQT
jgi:hypothetical protein